MTFLVFVLFLIGLIVFLAIKKRKSSGGGGGEAWPLYARKPMSQPEQVLYFRLVQALPGHIVLAQVQLSRMLGVKSGYDRMSWLNRINRMSADFVVCHKDATVVAVVELDDSSHERQDRREADSKKGAALSAAGIEVIRWNVKALPDENAIRERVLGGS